MRYIILIAVSLIFAPTLVEAAPYSFVKIADNAGPIRFFGAPAGADLSISNSGAVAFQAGLDDGNQAVMVGSGGGLTTIADSTGAFRFFGSPSINGAGQVVFHAAFDSGGTGLFLANGSTISPLFTSLPPTLLNGLGSSPAINENGSVAFVGLHSASGLTMFVFNGTTLTPITTPFFGFLATDARPGLNNLNDVAFTGSPGQFGVFLGDGGLLQTIDSTLGPNSNYRDLADLNDHGRGLFIGFRDVGGQAIYAFDGTSVAPIALAGTGQPFSAFGTYSLINNSGEIVFMGFLPSGSRALFTGPNPTADRLIGTGDMLDGSTVANIGSSYGINDNGQIAFEVFLTGGPLGNRSAIFRADPIITPEPASIAIFGTVLCLALAARRNKTKG